MNSKIVQKLIASENDKGLRLDLFLADKLKISRSASQKIINSELLLINKKAAKSNYKIQPADVIEIKKADANNFIPDIPIIFEDAGIIVIDKPSGITVHPAPGEKELTLAELLPKPNFVVHRLDKGTSGVMVFAKTLGVANYLKKQFHDRETKKVYKALVAGTLTELSGSIDINLGRSLTTRGKIIPTVEGRGAITDFKVIKEYPGYTFIEAMPRTGRTHQIRTHFSAIGHPLYGDTRYGSNEGGRIFLHSYSLRFINPTTKEAQEFISQLPGSLKSILDDLSN